MRLTSILLFFVCAQLVVFAQQQIPVEWLTVKQGLSQGFIAGIVQDKDGFMWFATNDGLNKYDGYKVTVYRNNAKDSFSLPDNMVSGIVEDEFENFWVATRNKGLFLFDKKTERFYPVKLNGEHTNAIIRFHYQHQKLLIFFNTNVCLYKLDTINLIEDKKNLAQHVQLVFDHNVQQKDTTLKANAAMDNQIFWTRDRQLWLLNADTLIQYQANKNYTHWTTMGYSYSRLGIQKNKTSAKRTAFLLNHDMLFLLKNNKLYKVDIAHNKVVETIVIKKSVIPNAKEPMLEALSNENLIIKINELTYLYNIRSNKLIACQKELAESGILGLYSSRSADGINWFPTSGFGVIKSDTRKLNFQTFKVTPHANIFLRPSSYSDNFIPKAVLQKYEGHVASFGSIIEDHQGVFWIYTIKGIMRYQPKHNTSTLFPFDTPKFYIYNLFNDKHDRLWMFANLGTNGQYLYLLNKDHVDFKTSFKIPVFGPVNNEPEFVRDLYSDDRGFVYLATEKGLYQLNTHVTDSNKRWTLFEHKVSDTNSLSSNSLWCIYPDPVHPAKYVWLGTTSNGFDRLDISTGQCIHYSVEDGLPNNVVYSILSDSANNLWMSTNKGLSCFNPITKTFQNFTSEDGLPCDEFNHFEYMKMKNGDLFFGGIGGYTLFKPEEVLRKQPEVPIVFTELSISNKSVDWKHSHGVLEAPITYAKTITLQPKQNMFTITFASLGYRSNLKKFYKYKLQGYNNTWTEPSVKNEATFTNLSPGTYTLFVTGTNGDGVWNAKGTSIEISILPAWYQTWAFKIAIALLCFLFFYGLYRYRLSQQLKVLKVRNRIASDLHDEIGSTLSSITMYSEVAEKMAEANSNLYKVAHKIRINSQEALDAMNDIVWAINTKNDDLHQVLNRIRNYTYQMAELKGFDILITENKNVENCKLDITQRKNIYLLLKEGVNNAAKYAQCNTLRITISYIHSTLNIFIVDDGIGFDLNKPHKSSGGNGLHNMKKRAEELHGDLIIETKPGKGTTIQFSTRL